MSAETEVLTLAGIVGAHGVKGWVKLRSYLENHNVLTTLGEIQLVPGSHMRAGTSCKIEQVTIDAVRSQGGDVVAHIAGVDDRNRAECLKGFSLKIETNRFPEVGDGEVYWRDIEGLKVWCRERESGAEVLLGAVEYLINTGANDVIVVRKCDGSVDERERLIPWLLNDVIIDINLDMGELWVDWFVDE